MLKLNVNQEKQLTFEVQIGGVQSEQVSSYLRIEIDGIQYGFPADVGRESITVNLPPLRTVTARKIKEGEEVQVKLEIIADGNYLTPWQDTFRLSNPLVIEAKIVDDEFNPAPAFKTKLVTEGKFGDQKQGVKLERVDESEEQKPHMMESNEDELTERIVNKLAEKLSGSFGNRSSKLNEQHKEPDGDEMPGGEADNDEEPDGDEVKEVKKVKKESKKISPKDLLNMTEEDVFAYMERAGAKNPQIQKIIYDQAEAAAGSSKPVDVLKEVVKILKAKK
jgi:hypothetical protein